MPALASFLPFFAIGSIWPSAFLGSLRGGAGAGAVVQEAPVNDQRSCETETPLRPKLRQDTHWGSTYTMLARFFELREFISADDEELAGEMSSPATNRKLKALLGQLADARLLEFMPSFGDYHAPNAEIVHSPNFESDTSRLIELSLVTEGSDMVLETYTRLMPVGFKLTSEIDARGNKFLKVFDKVDEGDVSNSMVMFERMLLDERQTICL
ncbi:hypothetical protein PC118_g16287 [Phytophthora cactorum]|uniref:Uncharacterized protein n=1 Tax=Phytophthora cactorum TaxID=29920 RepID=A0A8T1FJ12_9STRA|nr:hypothetical protein PC118_g16287 [Phytophthora cactorum]